MQLDQTHHLKMKTCTTAQCTMVFKGSVNADCAEPWLSLSLRPSLIHWLHNSVLSRILIIKCCLKASQGTNDWKCPKWSEKQIPMGDCWIDNKTTIQTGKRFKTPVPPPRNTSHFTTIHICKWLSGMSSVPAACRCAVRITLLSSSSPKSQTKRYKAATYFTAHEDSVCTESRNQQYREVQRLCEHFFPGNFLNLCGCGPTAKLVAVYAVTGWEPAAHTCTHIWCIQVCLLGKGPSAAIVDTRWSEYTVKHWEG